MTFQFRQLSDPTWTLRGNEISASLMSASDAELLTARLWMLLEEHQIASPKMRVKSRSPELTIVLLFKSKEDAELIASVMHFDAMT